jgi:CHAT domain-containing protein
MTRSRFSLSRRIQNRKIGGDPMPDARFRLDWSAGASAQLDVFWSKGAPTYQLKYTPPFRSTIRPPVWDSGISPEELDRINKQLDEFVATIDTRASKPPSGAPARPTKALLETVQMLGQQLHTLAIKENFQSDLSGEGLFLEIGMEEPLLNYPWELMHDGKNFLCLKHAIGRFVNGGSFVPPLQRPTSLFGTPLETLSVLLISVPYPEPRDEESKRVQYDGLPDAEAEATAITEVLASVDGIKLDTLLGRKAIYNDVFAALCSGSYQIIHFNGHAKFDEKHPHASALVLQDGNISAGAITRCLAKSPPVLCFVNACETTRIAAPAGWKDRYNIFGLARAFLETGAYLLGSRWKINDEAASEFAKKFYASLLQDGKPLGMAILEARKTCKQVSPPDEFGWANYTFYGDPRVCFLAARQ